MRGQVEDITWQRLDFLAHCTLYTDVPRCSNFHQANWMKYLGASDHEPGRSMPPTHALFIER